MDNTTERTEILQILLKLKPPEVHENGKFNTHHTQTKQNAKKKETKKEKERNKEKRKKQNTKQKN
eukprot:m.44056 g.44056  ORF g.44056 m.44056 type:complete len:65 (+) comp10043_c0_seq2:1215-1409(+)